MLKKMPTVHDKKPNTQRGSVFVYIMLGIAIFAALAYTMTKGLSGGQSSVLTARQADIAAAEIIDYARTVEQAVNKVRLNGCSENEISFTTAPSVWSVTQFDHTPQVDEKCRVFHVNGGGLSPLDITETDWQTIQNHIEYHGEMRVEDVGSNSTVNSEGSDLILWAFYLEKSICLAINEQLGIENPSGDPPRDTTDRPYDGVSYTGSFGPALNMIDAPELVGQNAGCFVSNLDANPPLSGADSYYGYFVLLER